MFSAFSITPFITSHINTSQSHWYTILCLYFKIGIQSPIFIPLQFIHDVAHTSLPAIHCIDSIYAPISCVPLSDKATNQIPHNFPLVILGATALRMKIASPPFSHQHHAHTPARGHEDSCGLAQGLQGSLHGRPSSRMRPAAAGLVT
jgi:hypothetical protein